MLAVADVGEFLHTTAFVGYRAVGIPAMNGIPQDFGIAIVGVKGPMSTGLELLQAGMDAVVDGPKGVLPSFCKDLLVQSGNAAVVSLRRCLRALDKALEIQGPELGLCHKSPFFKVLILLEVRDKKDRKVLPK